MAGIGVILFIAGVTAPFPDPVKIGFIVAGLACMAVAGSDFF